MYTITCAECGDDFDIRNEAEMQELLEQHYHD